VEGYLDNEQHFLTTCSSFTLKRNCLFSKLNTVISGFSNLSSKEQTAILLYPNSVVTAKLVNKYIQIMFKTRNLLDEGFPAFKMEYERGVILNEFFDNSDSYDSDTFD
jgi:hypothetical protein